MEEDIGEALGKGRKKNFKKKILKFNRWKIIIFLI